MKIHKSYLLIALFLLIQLFSSCKKETISIDHTGTAEDALNWIPAEYELTSEDLILSEVPDPEGMANEDLKLGFIGKDSVLFQEINGVKIIQGDIAIPDEIISLRPNLNMDNARAGVYAYTTLWPGGVIYYNFHSNVPSWMRNVFRRAMYEWNRLSGIRFVYRTNQPNYIQVQFESGNFSNLGMTGGKQVLGLSNNAEVGTAIHEIGHALGLIHEHQRTDRDQYIYMDPSLKNDHNFEKIYASYRYGGFDWASIMLYPSSDRDGRWDMVQRSNRQPFTNAIIYWIKHPGNYYAIPSNNDVELVKLLYKK